MAMRTRLFLFLAVFAWCTDSRQLHSPHTREAERERRTDPTVQALLVAASRGNLTGVTEMIVEQGVNTEVHDAKGWTPLNLASLMGQLPVAQFLVGVGANLETRENRGQTPLGSAAINGHLQIVEYFLSLSPPADVQAADQHGAQPLHLAAQYGFAAICNALLHGGADINSVTSINGWTPLHAACASGRVEAVKLLMDWEAQIDVQDYEGLRPVDVIGQTRNITRRTTVIIKCLLDAEMAKVQELCKSASFFDAAESEAEND